MKHIAHWHSSGAGIRDISPGRRTFVETVHVQLPDKGGDIGVFEVLARYSVSDVLDGKLV